MVMEAGAIIYITVSAGPTPEDHLTLDTLEHHIEEQAVTKVTQLTRVFRLSPSPHQVSLCAGGAGGAVALHPPDCLLQRLPRLLHPPAAEQDLPGLDGLHRLMPRLQPVLHRAGCGLQDPESGVSATSPRSTATSWVSSTGSSMLASSSTALCLSCAGKDPPPSHNPSDQAAARSRVQTQAQRRLLSSLVLVTILATSLLLTGGAFYYKEHSVHYLGISHILVFLMSIDRCVACSVCGQDQRVLL